MSTTVRANKSIPDSAAVLFSFSPSIKSSHGIRGRDKHQGCESQREKNKMLKGSVTIKRRLSPDSTMKLLTHDLFLPHLRLMSASSDVCTCVRHSSVCLHSHSGAVAFSSALHFSSFRRPSLSSHTCSHIPHSPKERLRL